MNSVSKDGTSPYHYLLRQQAKGKKEIASLEEIWSLVCTIRLLEWNVAPLTLYWTDARKGR